MSIHDSSYERRDADFYPTLDALDLVPALDGFLDPELLVWEPHAGEGHLVDALSRRGLRVCATELHERPNWVAPEAVKPTYGVDFLTSAVDFPQPIQVVMNPPYSNIDEHVRRALSLASRVFLLARSDWSYAAKRRGLVSPEAGFGGKIEICFRPRWIEDGKQSPKHNYAWYCWSTDVDEGYPEIWHHYRQKEPAAVTTGSQDKFPQTLPHEECFETSPAIGSVPK